MFDKILLDKINKLNQMELIELSNFINSLISKPRVTYIQRPVKCGQKHCRKCNEGIGHGLYWYAMFRYLGKQYMAYIGKEKREIDPLVELKKKQRRKTKPKKGGK